MNDIYKDIYNTICDMVSSGEYDFLFRVCIFLISTQLALFAFSKLIYFIRYSDFSSSEDEDIDSDRSSSNDKSIEDKSIKVKVRKVHNNLYSKYYSHYKDDSND